MGGQNRERKGRESLASPAAGLPNGKQSHSLACKGPSLVMTSLCLRHGRATLRPTRTHPESL